ncbi:hypothetical protein B1M_32107, partial [Burkholderia sp. TJI49]
MSAGSFDPRRRAVLAGALAGAVAGALSGRAF